MAQSIATEKRVLSEGEFAHVAQSHYPALAGLEPAALADLARRLRDYRAKARDIAGQRTRAKRGKPGPVPAASAPGETRVREKKQIFAAALKRVNARLDRHTAERRRERNTEFLQAALARKQAARAHRPDPGSTGSEGMAVNESGKRRTRINPGRIGSTSQQGKRAQAKRDGR
jgi:hypothetical protein